MFIGKDGKQLTDIDQIITIDVKIIPSKGKKEFEAKWLATFGRAVTGDSTSGQNYSFQTKISFVNDLKEIELTRLAFSNWEENLVNDEWEVMAEIRDIPFYFMDAQRDLVEDINLRTSNIGRMANKFQDDYSQELIAKIEKDLETLNEEAVGGSKVLSHIKKSLEELNQTVQGEGRGVEITPLPKKVRDLHKGMKIHFQDGESDSFSLEYHGMGTRSWASLLAFKARISWETIQKEGKPFFPILGLEEPEAHLHPNAQRMVYHQLSELVGQKIVSTHSPYLAAQCSTWELRNFSKKGDEVLVEQLNELDFEGDEPRKLKREVIFSKGELLFSKVIILFEGETEHQSFPIFFKKYFGKDTFELGITLVKVDGNNYKPFLLLASRFRIEWFIFSDYDQKNIRDGVDNALKRIFYNDDPPLLRVSRLEKSFENYLVDEGYSSEIKAGINNAFLATTPPNTDQRQILAGQSKINGLTTEQLKVELKKDDSKVRFPVYWAEEISKLEGIRSIPLVIRQLFEQVEKIISPKLNVQPESSTK